VDLFLDCEWADVLASDLVSLALVSLDLQHVFYAERDPLPVDPTLWVKTVVYPLLDRGPTAMSEAVMTRRLREFLASVERPRICYDFGADRGLCQYVINGFQTSKPDEPVPADLRWQLFEDMREPMARWWGSHPKEQARRHHALVDAHALRSACLSLWGI
jgi:hypothetical protein